MKRILFVCTGNTCRSPMAAALMQRELAARGAGGVECLSAGLGADEGEPASRGALAAMWEIGVDLSAHRARSVTGEDVRRADGIYVMSPAHAAALRGAWPQAVGRVRVLGGGIPDPYGGGIEIYRRCRDAIAAAVAQEAGRWAR